jgi:hypothetical protein
MAGCHIESGMLPDMFFKAVYKLFIGMWGAMTEAVVRKVLIFFIFHLFIKSEEECEEV